MWSVWDATMYCSNFNTERGLMVMSTGEFLGLKLNTCDRPCHLTTHLNLSPKNPERVNVKTANTTRNWALWAKTSSCIQTLKINLSHNSFHPSPPTWCRSWLSEKGFVRWWPELASTRLHGSDSPATHRTSTILQFKVKQRKLNTK